MTMLDRIVLAKAGYKKKEIEEMLAAESINNEETQTAAENQEEKEGPEKKEKEEPEKEENVTDKIQEELLAAFEEQKEEIANLQKQLKEAQTANTRIDMDVPSVEDREEEIIKILTEG